MSSSSHYAWTGRPKVRHESIESAEAHLADMINRDGDNRFRWGIYKCWCKGYHVGHSKLPHNDKTDPTLERTVGRLIGVLRGTWKYKL